MPSPSEFFGRDFPEVHSTVEEIVAYAEALAASSPRVSLEHSGSSVEGDPLLLLVLHPAGEPVDVAARAGRFQILDDPWKNSADERRVVQPGLKPATWIACSVHGDEASGSDAGLALAYWLAASQTPEVEELLRRSIVLIDPCQNPDGRRRFLQHLRSFGRLHPGPDPAPEAVEHHQLWPGGRRNHYLFDLNRDWAFLTQQESRVRAAAFLRWRPQVLVDLHEMGRESSYYFPPPADPVNPHVPSGMHRWWEEFGRANARAFDARGYDYFIREDFDLFYPGYGDSWPSLLGAVGMTFEQATTRGLRMFREDEGELNYAEAVRRHFLAAWQTCRTTARMGPELIQSVGEFQEEARRRASDHPIKAYILDGSVAPGRAARLATLLTRQGVRILRTTTISSAKLSPWGGGKEVRIEMPAGSYLIRLDQPRYALIRALMDPDNEMDPAFLIEEEKRLNLGLDDRFYDVTAWSLVHLFGVRAHESRRILDWSGDPVLPTNSWNGKRRGEDNDPVAWAIPYRDNDAPQAALALLAEGFRVSMSRSAFRQEGREFPRGTFILRREGNPPGLRSRLDALASRSHLEIIGLASGWNERGPSLGSNRIIPLHAPRIGLLTGPGTHPGSAGAWRWLFEERYGIKHSSILLSSLTAARLKAFDVLVVPEFIGKPELPLEELDAWVRGGGSLLINGNATARFAEEEGEWIQARVLSDLRELRDDFGKLGGVELPAAPMMTEDSESSEEKPEVPASYRPISVPGAILRLELHPADPLGAGLESPAFAPLLGDRLMIVDEGQRPLARYSDPNPRAAGFLWPMMEAAAAGMAFSARLSRGEGNVLWFAEDLAFRGIWEGLHPLFLNALLLLPAP